MTTVAQWMKKVIDLSGQSGTAGSSRSVASSNAMCRGVTLDKIMKAGDWARASTFGKYYKAVPLTLQSANLEP